MSKRFTDTFQIFSKRGLFLVVAMTIPTVSHAYVDPGSGSVLVTTVLGLIAAIGYTFRKYYYKFKNWMLGKTKQQIMDEKED